MSDGNGKSEKDLLLQLLEGQQASAREMAVLKVDLARLRAELLSELVVLKAKANDANGTIILGARLLNDLTIAVTRTSQDHEARITALEERPKP